ncbi:MAG TPA: hypothetical protein DGT21_20885 [Armatimonadetes bacterium]|jgi:hypothetical protein|nr:hypothetical protein [Armatimonadota bacterium]
MATAEHTINRTDEQPQLRRAVTVRSFVIAVAMLIGANIWCKYAALITLSAQVGMSVPPIPALVGLVLLLAVAPIGRAFRLCRQELLFVYVFLTLSVALTSGGALREFMPELTALRYFATPENGWAEYAQYLPGWLTPQDPEVIRTYYEGTEGPVPWAHWIVPLASWSTLFMFILGGMLCAAVLFYDEWSERERLSFQLTEIPLSMTAPGEHGRSIPQLWRDPVMWIGFGLSALYNLLNILHAFNPSVPALGLEYPLGGLFTERPWTALSDLVFYHQPDVAGLGYMMPQEVVVSSLVFYALSKAEAVTALTLGYDIPEFPHDYSQSAGSFVALGLFLIWAARGHLVSVFGRAFSGRGAQRETWAAWGLAISIVGALLWGRAAGMSLMTTALYFGMLLLMALTYARIRSETGLPVQWAYPVSRANMMLTSVFGTEFFKRSGGARNLTVYYTCWFLTRGYLPNLSAYHFESLRIADVGRIHRREMVTILLLALVLGMGVSYVVQLGAYYGHGANFLEGGTHGGGMRVSDAKYAYGLLKTAAGEGIPRSRGETIAIAWGIIATIGLTLIRTRVPRFPLHHLGFVIGVTRGYRLWGELLVAAVLKSVALRLGGVRLYRRLVPAAIGLVLGHFVLAGGVWSFVALFGGEAFRSYQVWFG